MLSLYTEVVTNVLDIVIQVKQQLGEPREYHVFVISEMANEITMEELFQHRGEIKKRFCCIVIPLGLMYKPMYILPWLVHELGHLVRFKWENKTGNALFYEIAKRAIPYYALKKYSKMAFLDGGQASKDFESWAKMHSGTLVSLANEYLFNKDIGLCHVNHCDNYYKCREHGNNSENCPLTRKKFKDQVSKRFELCVEQLPLDILIANGIPATDSFHLHIWGYYHDIIEELTAVFRELMADVFLIHTLKVTNVNQYLDMMAAFLNYTGNAYSNVGDIMCLRFAAISLLIEYGNGDTEELQYTDWTTLLKNIKGKYSHQNLDFVLGWFDDVIREGNFWILSKIFGYLKNDIKQKINDNFDTCRMSGDFIDRLADAYDKIIVSQEDDSALFNAHIELIEQLTPFM